MRYSPEKQASQKRVRSSPRAAYSPSSERYPSESAVTYFAISSMECELAMSSCRVGVSMP